MHTLGDHTACSGVLMKFEAFLPRLDEAIDLAPSTHSHTNEVNDDRLVLKLPSKRKRRQRSRQSRLP